MGGVSAISERATVGNQAATPPPEVKLPPAPPRIIPKTVQGLAFFGARRWTTRQLVCRYGDSGTAPGGSDDEPPTQ
ncbi:MAG TPA: hypothetical protein VEF72_22300 [Mycobacterium sp.]|nr:hypothetical protein [Mycobacterium sp.]